MRILKELSVTYIVTKRTDSTGVTRCLVSAASNRVKVLRFDIDPRTSLIHGNSSDLQRLQWWSREEYSKRPSKSARNITKAL